MRSLLRTLVLTLIAAFPLEAQVTVNVTKPTAGQTLSGSFLVKALVTSTYQLQTVIATIDNGSPHTLVFGCAPGEVGSGGTCGSGVPPTWHGTISLQPFVKGPHDLKVTATDVFGTSGQFTVPFIYDDPPILTVTSPLDSSVSRGQVRVTASCTDDFGCTSVKVWDTQTNQILAQGVSSVDQDISLAPYNGQVKTLHITATDSRGQETAINRDVSVESSIKLHEVDRIQSSGSIQIMDVQGSRLIYLRNDGGYIINPSGYTINIRDWVAGTDTVIPLPAGTLPLWGLLTPRGAIVITPSTFNGTQNGTPYNLFELRDGVVSAIGHITADEGPHAAISRYSLKAKGHFVAWSGSRENAPTHPWTTIFLHDIDSGTTTDINFPYNQVRVFDLAANGDVVFLASTNANDVWRYRNGGISRLTISPSPYNSDTVPVTDGANVLFKRFLGQTVREQHILYNSSGAEIPLTAPAPLIDPSPAIYHLANNGHYAYVQKDNSGVIQIWSDLVQVSFLGTSSKLDTLGPTGELTLSNGSTLYRASPETMPDAISTTLGQRFWLDGLLYVALGRSLFRVDSTPAPPSTRPLGDFDADGKQDLFWQHSSTGQLYLWLMNGLTAPVSGSLGSVADLQWKIEGKGDLNGDGRMDLVWRHSESGQIYIWLMNGLGASVPASMGAVSDFNWRIGGIGDLNGDARADIVWRHSATGQLHVWLMDGLNPPVSAAMVGPTDLNWQIVAIGDLNGDANADLLWRHSVTGQIYLWLMNGHNPPVSGAMGVVSDLNWKISGFGDLNGDGKSDVVWRNKSTGAVFVWLMNGLNAPTSADAGTAPVGWDLVGVGDIDDDGNADLIWRHVSGSLYGWLMNGVGVKASGPLGTVTDVGWRTNP